MTWSIVAHDAATGAFGVAVTTCAFAVGARCPFVRAGVGAVATQASVNTMLGPMVLDLLEQGRAPAEAISEAMRADHNSAIRQVHAVDRHGRAAAWTGGMCVTWCGHETHDGFSVAGNMLTDAAVVASTAATYGAQASRPLAERLLAALERGQDAGGDKRGRQSAALIVASTESFPDIDLRADDHATPLDEIRRLLAIYQRDLAPTQHLFPRKANFSGADPDTIEAMWKQRGLPLRFTR
jgi:uncharacterized Ntn-hydrolase superfamily protein